MMHEPEKSDFAENVVHNILKSVLAWRRGARCRLLSRERRSRR